MASDLEFTQGADRYMAALLAKLSDFDPDELDADLAQGVLSMTFADRSRCILNRQTAAQQLWLAQGASAWHFARDAKGDWLDTKGRGPLPRVLSEVLSNKLGRKIAL